MLRVQKTVGFLANIAIIVLIALLCVAGYKKYVLRSDRVSASHSLRIGARISLPETEWASSRQTLLLVLKEDCKFCNESMPFYRNLVQSVANNKGLRLIAIMLNDPAEIRRYLSANQLDILDVRQVASRTLDIRATPTLIVVDNQGRVTRSWVGKLTGEQEQELFSQLKKESVPQ